MDTITDSNEIKNEQQIPQVFQYNVDERNPQNYVSPPNDSTLQVPMNFHQVNHPFSADTQKRFVKNLSLNGLSANPNFQQHQQQYITPAYEEYTKTFEQPSQIKNTLNNPSTPNDLFNQQEKSVDQNINEVELYRNIKKFSNLKYATVKGVYNSLASYISYPAEVQNLMSQFKIADLISQPERRIRAFTKIRNDLYRFEQATLDQTFSENNITIRYHK